MKKKMKKKPQPKKAKAPAAKTRHEIVVRVAPQAPAVPTVSDLAEPMRDGKRMTLVPTWLNQNQLLSIVQRTPAQFVKSRRGRGFDKRTGKPLEWEYVEGTYIKKVLNYVFAWNWDFEVVEHGKEQDHVWVLGKLTVRGNKTGEAISKMQFGRSEVKYLKGTKSHLDYGNDLKSATTDALKKCASELGIASDIYGKNEYKESSGEEPIDDQKPVAPPSAPAAPAVVAKAALKPGQVIGPEGEPVWLCQDDSAIISEQVANYSSKVYGKRLCQSCQKNSKPRK